MVSTSAETAGAGRSAAGTATVYAWSVRTRRHSRAGSTCSSFWGGSATTRTAFRERVAAPGSPPRWGAGLPEDAVGRDRLLTDISVYWFSGTAGSSANLYDESGHDASAWAPKPRGTVPTGVAVALHTGIAIRRFAERDHNVTHWTELERGGNFLALEQPEAFVSDVRASFGSLDA
ncbi:hypothetical protein [Streptomyces sp. NBC_00893]|uniref:hypothetical protein n=1 Tax=Streptomyces sp. NBC_00893 TaxID=2975862 RepID=UPI002255F686|nr:hypothetical protein [Streptomyces sp. NBC_00893]MCX4851496.1 hypothetical protein [Streptomyces sp. NBC_00893]